MIRLKHKILIAEDEGNLRKLVCDYLIKAGFEVVGVKDGEEALETFFQDNYSLVLLDIMMPKLSGLEVCKEIRSVSDVPIVMLTAKNTEYDEIQGFNSGADEYIAKPFSPAILLIRIKSLLKRNGALFDSVLKYDELVIHQREREVFISEEKVFLTPKEYELLMYFIQNQNQVLPREIVLEAVWGFGYKGDVRTVDTHVKCLRAKLGVCADFVKTVRKIGYKFEAMHEN